MAGQVHIALMRGINVGGKHKVAMKDLSALFEKAGAREVRTYVQSGNVVFEAPASKVVKLASTVRSALADTLGIDLPMVMRTAAEWNRVVQRNPFLARGAETSELHVAFLADAPGRKAVASLDPARSPPDEFVVHGQEVYLRLPNGVAPSKLTNAYFDSKLGTVSTLRNWRTTLQLQAMANGS